MSDESVATSGGARRRPRRSRASCGCTGAAPAAAPRARSAATYFRSAAARAPSPARRAGALTQLGASAIYSPATRPSAALRGTRGGRAGQRGMAGAAAAARGRFRVAIAANERRVSLKSTTTRATPRRPVQPRRATSHLNAIAVKSIKPARGNWEKI